MSDYESAVSLFANMLSSIPRGAEFDAVTGRYDGDADPTEGLRANWIYVRDPQERNAPFSVWNGGVVPNESGQEITYAYNYRTKQNEILGYSSTRTTNDLSHLARPAVASILSLRNVSDLAVYATGNGLEVKIMSGVLQSGARFLETNYTLTPTVTAGYRSFVGVGVNLLTNGVTTSLTADRLIGASLLPPSDADSVIAAYPHIQWLAFVEVANAASSIDKSRIVDMRGWRTPTMVGADGSNAGVAGGVPKPSSSDNTNFLRGDGTWVNVVGSGTITGDVLPSTCEGRLTLTTGTPVTTGDVSAATTLYFSPHRGSVVALYDGASTWTGYTFTERSLDISGLSATTVYDIFIYDNSGTPTLEALAWTDATTRATALTTQNGVYVKTGATTRRYLGTIYIETAGQCDDSVARRHVYNAQNQVMRRMLADPSDTSHTYDSSTVREWNGGSTPGNTRVSVVVGLNENCVHAQANVVAEGDGAGYGLRVSVGLDSSAAGAAIDVNINTPATNQRTFLGVSYNSYVGIGAHTLRLLQAAGSATTTWHGQFSSMTAEILM